MTERRNPILMAWWIITVLLFAATMVVMIAFTPVEKTMGPVQKIFYVHLPVAINTFVAAAIVCVASIGYLWQRKLWWDDLAGAAGKVTALFAAVVLLTGMIWGKPAWGHWWTFSSPRLTLSLVLFLLYIVYVMIRPAIESPQRRAIVSAVYGIAAFVDVPLVYFSVKLLDEPQHPTSISLAPAMQRTLLLWFVPVTMLMAGLVATRFRLNRRLRVLDDTRRRHDVEPLGEGLGGAT